MEKYTKINKRLFSAGIIASFFLMVPIVSQAVTHTIQFGGSLGNTYSPASLTVKVGDTIKWTGSFSIHPLSSTTIPTGAASWHNTSGTSFIYTIKIVGTYKYQCDTHVSVGMVGSFTATESGTMALTPAQRNNSSSITVSANPEKTALQFTLPQSGDMHVYLTSLSGKEMFSMHRNFNEGFSQILLPSLPRGSYVVHTVFMGKDVFNMFSKVL